MKNNGIVIVLVILAGIGMSFLFTAGIVKLVTLCFGLAFSWKIALGVWLIMILISSVTAKSKR